MSFLLSYIPSLFEVQCGTGWKWIEMIRGSVSTSSARAKVVFLQYTHFAAVILCSSVFVAKMLKDPGIESLGLKKEWNIILSKDVPYLSHR